MLRNAHYLGLALALCYGAMSASSRAVVNIEFVNVGDSGNASHNVEMVDGTTGYGRVDYEYRMGKYEVTNSQYVEFLNAVAKSDPHALFITAMSSTATGGITRTGTNGNWSYTVKLNKGNKPVNFTSWFTAARFVNWLHNGQPTGPQGPATTEDGAYTFGVPNPHATHLDAGKEIVSERNPGALFFLPTEHEWHKAAFYEPDAVTEDGDEYWYYGNRNDTDPPTTALADASGNVSNPGPLTLVHGRVSNWGGTTTGNVMTVGSIGNTSYYGASDMSGNLFEWVESDPTKPDPYGAGLYVVRGGSYLSGFGHMRSTERNNGPEIGDGITSGVDFLTWQQEYGGNGPMTADFDHNLDVDSGDLPIWASAYNHNDNGDAGFNTTDGHVHNLKIATSGFRVAAPALPAVMAVPEPSAFMLSLLVVAVGQSFQRRLNRRVA